MNNSCAAAGRLTALLLASVVLCAPAALCAQTWNLAWSDEFAGPAGAPPNPANWRFETGNHDGFGNGEIQYYCAPASNQTPCDSAHPNLSLDGNGHLVLHAMQKDGQWTSGRMLTAGKHDFQYGRIEARMKMDVAPGFWPAFWMLGSAIDQQGWPKAGEQDIMEWVQKYTPTTTSSTVHGPGYSGGHGLGDTFTFPAGGRIDDPGFHIYGVLWSPGKLQFYRDDPAHPYFTLTPAGVPAGAQWVFDAPFYILLNFAIGGGGFPGLTNASTPASGVALVDFVRVYQSAAVLPDGWYTLADPASGTCLTARGKATAQAGCRPETPSQQWQLSPGSAGTYTLTSRSTRRTRKIHAISNPDGTFHLAASSAAPSLILTQTP